MPEGCKRCGAPLAYRGAVFCGAACNAKWEAGDRSPNAPPPDPARPHIDSEGRFRSDKYPWCGADFVPLKVTDPIAQRHLWRFAGDYWKKDQKLADDLRHRLLEVGYREPDEREVEQTVRATMERLNDQGFQFSADPLYEEAALCIRDLLEEVLEWRKMARKEGAR